MAIIIFMKWSPILHFSTCVIGTIGMLALIGAWIAGSGTFLGMTQTHLFSDAVVLMLIAIWLGLGHISHKWQETRK